MNFKFNRIKREKITVGRMIAIYCSFNHSSNRSLCSDCIRLYEYAMARLDKCPFGNEKPACNDCIVHCYKKDMKEEIHLVMRFSGPKMLTRHPLLAIMHIIDTKFKPKNLKIIRDSII